VTVNIGYLESLSVKDVTDLLSLHKVLASVVTLGALIIIGHGLYTVVSDLRTRHV
jgi:hypothetical protein